MSSGSQFVGIDVGTSGVRAVAIDGKRQITSQAEARMDEFSVDHRDPGAWRAALKETMTGLLGTIKPSEIAAISVDGTSGTMIPVDEQGHPVGTPMMYNDPVTDNDVTGRIASLAPDTSAALGANSALARAIVLQSCARAKAVIHQADWIAGQLSGRFDISDENNALKTGYDPVSGCWPEWINNSGIRPGTLPNIVEPGTVTGQARGKIARQLGLTEHTQIVAGTTDGCASFLATGANEPGDGVSALGSTLTVKLFSNRPVFSPQFGIYSHKLAGGWLAGGASNTGGNVLAGYFSAQSIAELSREIDPETDSGYDYYPLSETGERFPINDPGLEPKMSPKPDDDRQFLKAILEGIANVEAMAYQRLRELGAPPLSSIRTVGGGAGNSIWTRMRTRMLGVPQKPVLSTEAAFGTALLAMKGMKRDIG